MNNAITSAQNTRLKALRKLHTKRGRAGSGRFLAEGEDLIEAAMQAGREPLEGYRLAGAEIGSQSFVEVERSVFAEVSSLGSGTRVIGIYEQRWSAPSGPLCVYLHGVSDPGNVGTVLRSALAFGVASVVLGPGCADPHSPKAVRASMGAIFSMPIARVAGVAELPRPRIALSAHATRALDRALGEPAQGATLLIGAEREGLPDEVENECELRARIPIASESLNAAMAATVAMYEMTRGAAALDRRMPES